MGVDLELGPENLRQISAVTPGAQLSKDFSALKYGLPREAGRGLVWDQYG